jgi:tetratricopeptide (TPR) repeat protein
MILGVRPSLRWLVCALLFLGIPSAFAQTVDELDLRSQGDQRILRIRFNASVRFVQLVPNGTSDLYTLRFEFVGTDEAAQRQTNDEFRRLPAAEGLPELTLSYSPEPAARLKQITIRLAQPLPVQARQGPNARSIELLMRAAASSPAQVTIAAPRRYSLVLQTVSVADKDQLLPVPMEFQNMEVTTREILQGGVPGLEVVVSTFASREDADAALALVLPRFPQARLVELAGTVTGAAINTAASQPEAAAPDVEAEAATLMSNARGALAARRSDEAVTAFERVLRLPPNSQSMAAQELIGQTWDEAGNAARARVEYALFLKLYPKAESAGKVAQRLAALGGAPVPVAAGSATETARAADVAKPWSGSIAQYYYGGKSKNTSLVNIATGIDRATLSKTTESSVVTSVDVTGRLVGEGNETRAVVRGSQSKNLLSTGHSSSSIGSVYVEHRRGNNGLAVRVGRQSPISGGLLGLFDGVSLAIPVAGMKLDVMGGVPASALVSAPGERLFATVLEADQIAERFGGNFYLLDQSTQGITNRRALGSELRYAGDEWSSNVLLDYDAVFAKLNALSLHGSVQLAAQTTVTMLVDMRRAPSLQLSNALISSGSASLRDLLDSGKSLDDIRRAALDTSAIARQWLISVSRPFDQRWQVAMDLRYSAVGALPQVGDFEATDATGAQYSFSAQVTGTNLYSQRDINNFNLSVMSTPFFNGAQFSYNNLTGMWENNDLSVEPSIRVYAQRNKQQEKLLRIGPGVRLTYRQSARSSLLGELLYETSRTDGPTNHESSNSIFFYVGYRYELF